MDRGAWQATTHEVKKESSLLNQWDGVKETIITDSIKIELKYKKKNKSHIACNPSQGSPL